MKFNQFDAVRYHTRPRLNTPAAVMANAALAVAEIERYRAALRKCRDNPGRAESIAHNALQRRAG